jgi:hypothetical protein
MQPLFIFSRAITGLSPAPKTASPRRLVLVQITTPQTTNPAHGRVWLLVLIEDHPASVTA